MPAIGMPRVELKGAPANDQVRLRPIGQRTDQPALSDVAPGADRIGEDLQQHADIVGAQD